MRIDIKIIKKVFLILIVFVVLSYGYNQSKNMFKGPEIFITSPDPFSSIYGNTIKIIGQANRANFLLLNGNQIYTDNNGHFEEQLLAPFGYNIIKLQAKDNFGHEKIVVLEYLVKAKKSLSTK